MQILALVVFQYRAANHYLSCSVADAQKILCKVLPHSCKHKYQARLNAGFLWNFGLDMFIQKPVTQEGLENVLTRLRSR